MSGIMEEKIILERKRKPTLVRRVSDMLKDGNYSGPPILLRHASMQKIRHCCQNLNFNVLPYLLYCFDYSKSHPIARKVHISLNRFVHDIVIISLLASYENLRLSLLREFQVRELEVQKPIAPANDEQLVKPATNFSKFEKPKRKQHSHCLIAAVYTVPLMLTFQMTVLCGLTITSNYTPGFIFLIVALFFLAIIGLKILLHDNTSCDNNSNKKGQSRRKKIQ